MVNPKLLNRRCFVETRCSSKSQIGTSLDNQDRTLDQLLAANRMTKVGEIELAGVTGSVPGARDDIDEIIRRKRAGLDFDLLVLPTTDRFTRSGSLHGGNMLWDLEGAGIAVYFVAEQLFSDDPMHRIILTFLFEAAQQTAAAIGRGATAGTTNSYLDGRSPHTRVTPYGLDRLYSSEGRDRHVLRNLPDGTQQMLDPQSGELIRTFGRNPEKGTPCHYIKQKGERVRLVAGDPRHVAVVYLIHEAVHVRRRSIHSVAKELNDAGVPSPKGTSWDWSVVKKVAFNPAYHGILVRGRTTGAVYFVSAPDAPVPATVDRQQWRDRKRLGARPRPAEHWMVRQDPLLAEFLPESIRAISRRAVEAELARVASKAAAESPPRPSSRSKDRHRQSGFILKGVLNSKQGGRPMSGKVCGRGGDRRYYRIARAQNAPKAANVLARTVPATPLERAVLAVVREVLLSRPDLEAAVRTIVGRQADKARGPAADHEAMERELKRKQRQVAAALENLTGDEEVDAPVLAKIDGFRAEVVRLRSSLGSGPKPAAPVDVDMVVAAVVEELLVFGEQLDGADNETVREVVGLLVGRMEVDLVTREVELELSLPAWLGQAGVSLGPMSLDQAFAWRTPNETHRPNAAELGSYRCRQTNPKPVCFECYRVRRAA